MAQASWTLNEKMRPDQAEEHARLERELADAKKELARIGLIARLLPGPGKRRRELKAVVKNASVKMQACFGPPGFDLKPPRIGIDEKATKWYRKHLSQDPDAWPLSMDEMIQEMRGQPVWHLSKIKQVQHLDVGWPTGGFPVPSGLGVSVELHRKLKNHLTPEQAVDAGERLQEAVLDHFRSRYAALEGATYDVVVGSILKGAFPGGPKGSIDPAEVEQAHGALSAAQWLVFWGKHGYTFKCSEPMG